MKRKGIWIVLLLLMLSPLSIQARAGGGGGGGGGSGGGSSGGGNSTGNHSTYYGGRRTFFDRFMNVLTVGVFVIVIPAIPTLAYRNRVRKKAKASEALLQTLDDTDAIWMEDAILKRAEEIYYHVQDAWTNQDVEALRPYLTDHLFEQWQMKLNWMEFREERNVLKNISLLSHKVVGVEDYVDDDKDSCWLYIEGSMVDYTLRTTTHEIIDGSRKKQSFVEFWKLQRKGNRFYLDEVKQKDEVDPENFLDWREE